MWCAVLDAPAPRLHSGALSLQVAALQRSSGGLEVSLPPRLHRPQRLATDGAAARPGTTLQMFGGPTCNCDGKSRHCPAVFIIWGNGRLSLLSPHYFWNPVQGLDPSPGSGPVKINEQWVVGAPSLFPLTSEAL